MLFHCVRDGVHFCLLSLLNSQGFNLTKQNFQVISRSLIVQWELVKQGIAICGTLEEIGDNERLVERIVP